MTAPAPVEIPADTAATVARDLARWYADAARDLPWRKPGFSAWGVLVSEIMLQQTPVNRVIPRLDAWLERWPTPADLAAEPVAEAVRAWDRLGYPRRAVALHAAATQIVRQHGGSVPDDVESLLALPGIGDYTARAIAAFAFGVRAPVVDTNTRRVLARAIGGAGEAGPPSTRRDLALMSALLPEDPAESVVVNAAAMELGQVVCTARSPRCDDCPLASRCAWRSAGYPAYTGKAAPRQARFEGSDRQVRGRIMAMLREADRGLSRSRIGEVDPDPNRVDRLLADLVRDGLAVRVRGSYRLPI